MRTKLIRPLLFCLLSLTVFSGCQKSSDNPNADKNAIAAKTSDLDGAAIIPENACTDDLKKLAIAYIDNEKHIISLRESIKNKKEDSNLTNQYKERSEKQVENCKSIEERFKKESIVACLKKAGSKTKENTIFANDYANTCKAVGLRSKNATKKDNQYTIANQIATLQFSDAAKDLIQPSNKSEITFITNKEIKFGKENFMRAIQEGTPTCYMLSYASSNLPEDLTFKYVADGDDSNPPTKLDFEFNGTRTLIAIEADSIYSMLCLNLKLTGEKNKKAALEKIFGSQIKVIEKTIATTTEDGAKKLAADKLNQEVVPTPSAAAVVPGSTPNPQDDPNAKLASATNGTAMPAKNQLSETLASAATQVKDVADHSMEKASTEVSKTLDHAEAVGTALIEKTKVAAKEVAQQAIVDAKNEAVEGIKDLIKAPFIAVGKVLVGTAQAVIHPVDTYHKISDWFSSTFSSDEKPKQSEKKN